MFLLSYQHLYSYTNLYSVLLFLLGLIDILRDIKTMEALTGTRQ